MVNFTIPELVWIVNPFSGVYLAFESSTQKRQLFFLKQLQEACYQVDDDMRWLVALINDTGMRLAEAA